MATWAGCVMRRENEVDSTNRVARAWAREGAPHGAVVVAARQTAGRGRRGRIWESAAGMGLWLSIVVRAETDGARALLSLAAALAAADALTAVCGADARIKWPNDILIGGRKVVGILAEIEGGAVVIGIGVNVRQREEDFAPELRARAGSLEMLTGRAVSMEMLERALLDALEDNIGRRDILAAYEARCATLGSAVRIVDANGTFCGTAEALDDVGALLVRDDAGALRRVLAADVSVRGLQNDV